MPKYILEVDYREKRAYNEQYISHERLEFERDDDKSAFNYAFSAESIPVRAEDKKLYKVLNPHGSTKRIYSEDE